jgi:two-component system chemotaxis response regulator CheY
MPAKRVLSIGQCGADHGAIARALRQYFGAEVVLADDADEALTLLRTESFDLALVNRRLDSDGASGLEIIRQLKADENLRRVPVMLVSNYDDAQAEAVEAGAERGFGKAALGQPAMLGRVRPFLDCNASDDIRCGS